jgi:hypothetical protein
MLGHASAAMTLDVYAGLFSDELDALAERLDQMHRSSSADSMRTRPAVTIMDEGGREGQNLVDLG